MIDIKVPQIGNTFYGDRIISFREMLIDVDAEKAIRFGLSEIFGKIGLSEGLLSATIGYCVDSVKNCSNLLDYEHLVRSFLEQKSVINSYNVAKKNRASGKTDRIKKYLVGETVLDLGCGSGKNGAEISKNGYEVTLADVYKNPNISELGLPFVKVIDDAPLPFEDASFDNVLMLSMLHHVQNPLSLLDEIKRILKKDGRIHLVETVYGVHGEVDSGYGTDNLSFKSLSTEHQRLVTMFFDYFANHILDAYTEDADKYVPVPFNFTTPENLENVFFKKGFKFVLRKNLGIYPFSYVYHIHYVYAK